MIRRAVVTWALMIPIAILNGTIRNAVVEPVVGELPAHQISVVTGSGAFFALVFWKWHTHVDRMDERQLARMGVAWLAGTVLFEFGFGHFVAGNSWQSLLHDYNIAAGRMWPVFLLVVMLSPLGVKRLVKRQQSHSDRRPAVPA
jgi:hypothetical protein